MTYALSAALQVAVYDRLISDPGVSASVGGAIYDAFPAGPLPEIYVVLGAEDVRDASDKSGYGADHALTISVVTSKAGFVQAKAAAAAISDALFDADLVLSRGTLVSLNFHKAKAMRIGTADTRQINLIFRARVADA